ncbi:Protein CBG27705 [Caenorhabditis briggsae]|uniref:Uncharacterized protein n=2 Tax=Caenorhabditis briggsae TaxID=6238 RepID=A0AAE9CUK5_CAEBR|nr:Protein CBG27705 [Caenorhabditis briggsae]ULT82213.1 hypothetical protein L3Y34_011883 [Caenorhabditis briggsae]CAR99984.1 Protein CBG27705 [Caenorhabditis briggsae]
MNYRDGQEVMRERLRIENARARWDEFIFSDRGYSASDGSIIFSSSSGSERGFYSDNGFSSVDDNFGTDGEFVGGIVDYIIQQQGVFDIDVVDGLVKPSSHRGSIEDFVSDLWILDRNDEINEDYWARLAELNDEDLGDSGAEGDVESQDGEESGEEIGEKEEEKVVGNEKNNEE